MKIRNVSLCLIRRDDQILVAETFDNNVKKTVYRPVGGLGKWDTANIPELLIT